MKLGLFVELVLIRASLVLDDSVDGIDNLLVGFGVAGAITVENFIADHHKWYTAHVLVEIFSEILHEGFIILVAPYFEGVDIDFVFGLSW